MLIIGSGFSYHNLRQFNAAAAAPSAAFDAWLRHALIDLAPAERAAALLEWDKAPAARICHPQADHLIPLMVAVGAAGNDPGICVYSENDLRGAITASSYRFGSDTTPSGFDRIGGSISVR